MLVYIDESTYQTIVDWLNTLGVDPDDFVGIDGDDYYFDYIALMDAGYIEDVGGAIYLISLKPSQKGIFIGNL